MSQKYIICFHRNAKKTLNKIPDHIGHRVDSIIDELETNPYLGVKMNGDMDHLRKIKVSNYRIIYQIIESKIVIEIMEIESRGNTSYDR